MILYDRNRHGARGGSPLSTVGHAEIIYASSASLEISSSLVQAPTEARSRPAEGIFLTITARGEQALDLGVGVLGLPGDERRAAAWRDLMSTRAQLLGQPLRARGGPLVNPFPAGSGQNPGGGNGPCAADHCRKSVVQSRCSFRQRRVEQRPVMRNRRITRERRFQVVEPVGPHVQRTAALRPTHPLLARGRVEIDPKIVHVERDRPERLRRVEQNLDTRWTAARAHP